MSKNTDKKNTDRNLEVGEVISNTEKFIENNQKKILIIISALIILVGGYFAYAKFYVEPREQRASEDLFAIEQYYKNDDYEKALNGDGKHLGLLNFIDKYKNTKSGNLARYYAGTVYLNTGEYDNAIIHLKKFKSKDQFLSAQKHSLMADAYMEIDEVDKAIAQYNKSLSNPNDFTTPFNLLKLGLAYEIKGNNTKALEAYKRIKEEFPASLEYRDIEKYISRLEALNN